MHIDVMTDGIDAGLTLNNVVTRDDDRGDLYQVLQSSSQYYAAGDVLLVFDNITYNFNRGCYHKDRENSSHARKVSVVWFDGEACISND
jgi:hypothetical protein